MRALQRPAVVAGYAFLAVAWFVWLYVLARTMWLDQPADSGRSYSAELSRVAGCAQQWFWLDIIGLLAGTVAFVLLRDGWDARRLGRWGLIAWVVCMIGCGVGGIIHAFAAGLPLLQVIAVLSET